MHRTRNQSPLYFIRRGQPVDGPQGTLAGIAEPGARLMSHRAGSQGGSWVNQGTKQSPKWERPPGYITIT